MTISRPDPLDQRDVPPTLSGLQAQIHALRSDLTVFSDDRRGIVAQIASLVVDVSRLTQAAPARHPSPSSTTAAKAAER